MKNPTWDYELRKKWPTRRMRVLGKGAPGGSRAPSFRALRSNIFHQQTQRNAIPHANVCFSSRTSPSLPAGQRIWSQHIKSCERNRCCQVLSHRQLWAFVAKLRSLLWMEKEKKERGRRMLCVPAALGGGINYARVVAASDSVEGVGYNWSSGNSFCSVGIARFVTRGWKW